MLDPRKWRIVPARAEAWCDALVELGLATLDRDASVRWAGDDGREFVRVDRLAPRVSAGLPLVLAYASFDTDEINGVTVGTGEPAVEVTRVAQCGCDACDSGSQAELDVLDDHVAGIVSGAFRHLSAGSRTITVHQTDGWSASGVFRRGEVESALDDPAGWHEITGPSWLSAR